MPVGSRVTLIFSLRRYDCAFFQESEVGVANSLETGSDAGDSTASTQKVTNGDGNGDIKDISAVAIDVSILLCIKYK
jgi:hypothetical protein